MKKGKYKKIIIPAALISAGLLFACSKSYLTIQPVGALSPSVLSNKTGAEGLLIGAYSLLEGEGMQNGGGNGPWATSGDNWVYGSDAGGDSHKGSDPGDQNLITPIETWDCSAANNYLDDVWQARYAGVQRANEAIRVSRLAKDMTPADTLQLVAEARFLRAHYHFELRKIFGNVPWIDESITYSAGNFLVPNSGDILPQIEADLTFAVTNLPLSYKSGGDAPAALQGQIARANRSAAKAYLLKCLLFEKKYAQAVSVAEDVIANGMTSSGVPYALTKHFSDNFNAATKNNSESVFAAQNSVNDGSGAGNANAGDVLNFPYTGGPGGCCGFFQPSYSLANSFKVDPATGLPLLDGSYNNTDLKNDYGLSSNQPFTPDNTTPVDPRLDWTVGRRGIPYLDWGPFPGANWIRNQASAGPYAPVKDVYYQSQQGTLTDNSSWTSGYTALNQNLIRFADVLLMGAEAEVLGGGSLHQATVWVNQVRARAADPTGWVKNSPANYMCGLYPADFADANSAMAAIMFERKIELAMEGHRFFDLVRWGTAAAELNAYAAHEAKSNYALMVGATFTVGKSEYLPIPQAEIDLSSKAGKSVLTQNPGY